MKRIFFIATMLCSTPVFAFFCPTGFNQVTIGNTIDEVILQCGKPDSIKTYPEEENVPQEWNYYVRIQPIQQPQTGSMRMTIAFNEGKVINMSVNGAGVTNTAVCGKPITLDMTQKQIEAICGKPVLINKGSTYKGTENAAAKPDEITEFKYSGNTPATFIFKNGKLRERKQQ